MINELLNDWKQSMTGTEQYHAQAIDVLEDRIAKLEISIGLLLSKPKCL